MKLTLATASAERVVADLLLVKHFDGVVGGAEAAINERLRGFLQPVFDNVEQHEPPVAHVVRAEQPAVASPRLLVLGLGELDEFGLEDLRRAIRLAATTATEHGFARVATPVIGTSEQVGLPPDRAFRVLVHAFLRELVAPRPLENDAAFVIEELTVFDDDEERIAYLDRLAPAVLTELGITFTSLGNRQYDIEVGIRAAADDEGSVVSPAATEHSGSSTERRARRDASTTKILFLAANPIDARPLRLSDEIRDIDTAIRQAEYRASFDIRQAPAVRISDLQAHLLRHRPQLVHFSGHGTTEGRIVLQDALGRCDPVPAQALNDLFGVFSSHVRCVVLNACYSKVQAEGIVEAVDCVVGMGSEIDDRAAVAFAQAFYQALAYGQSVQQAFILGRVQVGLEGLEDDQVPQLATRSGVDADDIVFCAGTPL